MTATGTGTADKVPLAGGTMTGALTLAGAPSSALQAMTKGYADAGFSATIVYAAGWPSRPSSVAFAFWIGPSAPSIGGSGAQPQDIWLQTGAALVEWMIVSGVWTPLSIAGSGGGPPPPPPPAATGRVGAAIPGIGGYGTNAAAWPSLTGYPLSAWRAELGGDPIPTTVASTYLKYLPSQQCRAIIDLEPDTSWANGSGGTLGADVPAFKAFLADLQSSRNVLGYPVDVKMSLWHELRPMQPAPFIQVFQLYADIIHNYSPFPVIYCVDGYEVAVGNKLAPYYPGDSFVDCVYIDAYIGTGLAALPIAASFSDAHGKLFGLAEFSVQDTCSTCHNYGTQSQNIAYLTGVYNFLLTRWQAGNEIGDLTYWQGFLSAQGEGDFRLASNTYAITQAAPNFGWDQFYATFNSFTGV